MAHITVGTTSTRADYTASASQTAFSVPFEFFDEDDLLVYKNNALLTKTANYTVTPVTTSDGGFDGGTVTLTSGAASGDKVAIVLSMPHGRASDFPTAGPFNVTTLNTTLDKNAVRLKQLDELSSRSARGPASESGLSELPKAADRANKVMSFDASGDVQVSQEIGEFKGNWAASTVYVDRDIVKDSSTLNIYICLTGHTSSGSAPISTNTDAAKWALLVDAASATTSKNAAAASETAAASSQTAAASSASAAASSQSASASSASSASTSASSASTSAATATTHLDTFQDQYLGSASSDPSTDLDGNALADGALYFDTTNNVLKVYDLGNTTWRRGTPTSSDQTNINSAVSNATNINTVAGISSAVSNVSGVSSAVSTVSGISSAVSTVSGISSDVSTTSSKSTEIGRLGAASAVADMDLLATTANVSNMSTVAGSISNVNTTAGSISSVNTTAGISAHVSTVSGISAAVSSVSSISGHVSTVSGISSDVTATAGKATEIGRLGTTAAVADMATLGTTSSVANLSTVAGAISAVNTTSTNIASVNTTATNIAGVNSFAARYRVAATAPSTDLDEGDLYYDTNSNKLRFYDGSAWNDSILSSSGGSVTSIGITTSNGIGVSGSPVTTTGNIALSLGDITPTSFDVYRSVSGGTQGTFAQITNSNNATNDVASLLFGVTNGATGSANYHKGGIHFKATGSSNVGQLILSANPTNDSTAASTSDARLTLDGATHNAWFANWLGVGVNPPAKNLHVKGGTDTRTRTEESSGTFVDTTVINTGHYLDSVGAVPFTINKHTSGQPLHFNTNNTNAMTITSVQDVGIGTTSPTTFTGYKSLHLKNGAGNAVFLIESDGGVIGQSIVSDGNGHYIGARSNHDLILTSNDTPRLTISAGGDATFNGSITSKPATGSNMHFQTDTGTAMGRITWDTTGTGHLKLRGDVGKGLKLGANGGDVITVDTSGNMILGGTSPSMGTNGSGLHIKGSVHAVLKLDSGADDESKIQFTENGTDQWRIGYDAASGHLEFTESGVADVLTLADGGKATFSGYIHVNQASGGNLPSATTNGIIVQKNAATTDNGVISLIGGTAGDSRIEFGDIDDRDPGMIRYTHANNTMEFWTNGAAHSRMNITSAGDIGIGTSSVLASSKVEIQSDANVLPTATTTSDDHVAGWRVRRNKSSGSYNHEWYMGMRETNKGWELFDNTNNARRFYVDTNGHPTFYGQMALLHNVPKITMKDTTTSGGTFQAYLEGQDSVGTARWRMGRYDSSHDDLEITNISGSDILWKTNNAEVMRLKTGGALGIGTSTVPRQLSVYDAIASGSSVGDANTKQGTGHFDIATLRNTTGPSGAGFSAGMLEITSNHTGGNVRIGARDAGSYGADFVLETHAANSSADNNTSERLRITAAGDATFSGNVTAYSMAMAKTDIATIPIRLI